MSSCLHFLCNLCHVCTSCRQRERHRRWIIIQGSFSDRSEVARRSLVVRHWSSLSCWTDHHQRLGSQLSRELVILQPASHRGEKHMLCCSYGHFPWRFKERSHLNLIVLLWVVCKARIAPEERAWWVWKDTNVPVQDCFNDHCRECNWTFVKMTLFIPLENFYLLFLLW